MNTSGAMARVALGGVLLAAAVIFVLANRDDMAVMMDVPVGFWPAQAWLYAFLVLACILLGVALIGEGARTFRHGATAIADRSPRGDDPARRA